MRSTRAMRVARRLLVAIAVFGGVTPWFADYNATHIFNPDWSPHAVFHSGQVLAFTSMSSLGALYFLLLHKPADRTAFLAGWMLASVYWFSLAAAILFPNAAWIDPEFQADPSQYVMGVPGNAFVCLILVPCLLAIGRVGLKDRATAGAEVATGGDHV